MNEVHKFIIEEGLKLIDIPSVNLYDVQVKILFTCKNREHLSFALHEHFKKYKIDNIEKMFIIKKIFEIVIKNGITCCINSKNDTYWYENGILHCDCTAAIFYSDPHKIDKYYLYGTEYTYNDWLKTINILNDKLLVFDF